MDLEVRVVELEPLRVASAHGFGEQPEPIAIEKLQNWAAAQGLLTDPDKMRIFGFNNPCPSAGSPNYGYEIWMVVDPEVKPMEGISIKEFPGGLYAVARCQNPFNLPETWQQMVAWRETSAYGEGQHQWLEQHLNFGEASPDQMLFDVYVPLKK